VSACAGKKKFGTQTLAEEVASAYAGGSGRRRRWPYRCDGCGCWHISSISPEQHQAYLERRQRHQGARS